MRISLLVPNDNGGERAYLLDASNVQGLRHQFEQVMILHAFTQTNGKKAAAAKWLGINRTTLIAKMKRHLPAMLEKRL